MVAHYTNRVVDIVKEGYDLAIRVGATGDGDLTASRLREADYVLFANPAYLADRGAPKRPRKLGDHDTVVFGALGRNVELSLCKGQNPRRFASPRVSSSTTT